MHLYDIGTGKERVSLEQAVFKGLASDGSLYMPESIPKLPPHFFEEIDHLDFPELSFEISKALIGEDIPEEELRKIVRSAINFPAPLVALDENTAVLELFHGPSLAFKDFGARFMARLMSHFLSRKGGRIHILVATSGDTGGAVAAGFFETPNIEVTILYPSGKVSPLQEKQLTTWGKNITALEIQGSFDDCQALVKRAFTDPELAGLPLSSANSINIARLIPQTFYYFEAFRQTPKERRNSIIFSVPSGNFGNLTAGLIAKKMGLPAQFIAATNINRIVPEYLESSKFTPKPSIPTLSNAMDVGNPSNFSRMLALYGSTWNKERGKISSGDAGSTWNDIRKDIKGVSFNDTETLEAIQKYHREYNYLFDPHGAIGMLGRDTCRQKEAYGLVLETAHPAKFSETIQKALGKMPKIPAPLQKLTKEKGESIVMSKEYEGFREYLRGR